MAGWAYPLFSSFAIICEVTSSSACFLVGDVGEALSLDTDLFQERYGIPKPTQDSDIIFHCKAGVRSLVAIDIANKLGYSRLVVAVLSIRATGGTQDSFLASKFEEGGQHCYSP